MYLRELTEAVTTVWGRKGSKTVRKYKCTSGSRKGRIVSKAGTCTAPINISKSKKFKQTKRRQATPIKIKSRRTKKFNPASQRMPRINTRRKSSSRKSTRRKKI